MLNIKYVNFSIFCANHQICNFRHAFGIVDQSQARKLDLYLKELLAHEIGYALCVLAQVCACVFVYFFSYELNTFYYFSASIQILSTIDIYSIVQNIHELIFHIHLHTLGTKLAYAINCLGCDNNISCLYLFCRSRKKVGNQ